MLILGKLTKYSCNDCGFEYLKDEPFIFYFDSENNKIHEVPLTELTSSLINLTCYKEVYMKDTAINVTIT